MREKKQAADLSSLVADLKEDEALELAQQMIDHGEDPLIILEQSKRGLYEVGKRYEERTYFISALIMGGEIMNRMSHMLFPILSSNLKGDDSGHILLGTVQGDIHFIGKDIFKVMARCHGFMVTDLGVDVSPQRFLEGIAERHPDIVGISCLLDTGYESLKETITQIREADSLPTPLPAFVIGGFVDQLICDHVTADFVADDAMKGVRICQEIMKGKNMDIS